MKQRQPFDIYEDQYTRLKQIANSERSFVNGRGMNQMVREAIDAYLATENFQTKSNRYSSTFNYYIPVPRTVPRTESPYRTLVRD